MVGFGEDESRGKGRKADFGGREGTTGMWFLPEGVVAG